jgi:NAD+ kinase
MVKSVGIISKPAKPEIKEIASGLVQWLEAHGYKVFVDKETVACAPGSEVEEREQMAARKPEFVVVLGGDGTILSAARVLAGAGIPILGVNLGSLGFLTEVTLAELYPTLEAMEKNQCATESRSMMHCQLERGGKCVASYEALNDAVVSKNALARIADFEVQVDGAVVSSYKADGLILATPTGSTAYSLAAGGPVLAPDVAAFVITPISSHALTNRPLVVRDSAEIVVMVKSIQEKAYLTVDGQVGMPVHDGDRLVCRKSQQAVKLLRQPKRTFFDVLRGKLKWGER